MAREMKMNRGPVGDWVFFALTGVILAGCVALAVLKPNVYRDSSTEDRLQDLELRCLDLEMEVERLKRASSDHSMQILELEDF
jgi:hypothetical protein